MDKVEIGMLALAGGLGLIALRIQIGVALGIVSFFGIAAILNMRAAWGIITAIPFNFVGDWNLTAIPMFLLMGFVASETGISSGSGVVSAGLPSRFPSHPPKSAPSLIHVDTSFICSGVHGSPLGGMKSSSSCSRVVR